MYKIILKNNLGYLIAEKYTEFSFYYSIVLKLEDKIIIYNNEFDNIEILTIPKNLISNIELI